MQLDCLSLLQELGSHVFKMAAPQDERTQISSYQMAESCNTQPLSP